MATKKEIADDIKRQYGSLLSTTDAATYLGMCRAKTRKFLADLTCYDTGKEHKYLAIDIARKLDNCEFAR